MLSFDKLTQWLSSVYKFLRASQQQKFFVQNIFLWYIDRPGSDFYVKRTISFECLNTRTQTKKKIGGKKRRIEK